jgi:hypothetical protein
MFTSNANAKTLRRSIGNARRLVRVLVRVGLATLAFALVALPTSAATPQPWTGALGMDSAGAPGIPALVSGDTNPQSSIDRPNATCPPDGQCFADVPPSNPFYAAINNLYQQDVITGFACGGPGERCDAYNRPYYRPTNNLTRQLAAQFLDNSRRLPGISIDTTSNIVPISVRTTAYGGYGVISLNSGAAGVGVRGDGAYGVYGVGIGDDGIGLDGWSAAVNGYGVRGVNTAGVAVYGVSSNNTGVQGVSGTGYGISGISTSGSSGVYGATYNYSTYGAGVYGYSPGSNGHGVVGIASGGIYSSGIYGGGTNGSLAGYFVGNVAVTGNLSKGAGSFKIDHPLDPANKYLYHSFVESPDMMNIYNGNVTTDAKGEATVHMPDYFEALNRDFRYQLTVIGQFAQAIVGQEIEGGKFVIKTDKPNVKVSWQVTGIRHDPYADKHRIPVEEEKTGNERGKYLHPTEWGKPESLGVDYEQTQKIEKMAQDGQELKKP